MEILDPALHVYVEQHTSPESDLLKSINRDTHAKVMMPRMLSGHVQGRYLAMLSKLMQPKVILELGTYTGYSAICLAEGLPEDGKLITIDVNEELEDRVRGYFDAAGIAEKVDYRIGKALEIIPALNEKFDLIFIDADKENNGRYYDLLIDKLNPGGLMLVDNVLWSGKVVAEKKDKDTQAILDFNKKVQDDPRVENILLPLRDGILMIRKVSL